MRVALVTCLRLPEPDPDEDLLLAALRSRGVAAEMLAWDDPAADPSAFDLCVVRSTWNYCLHFDGFSAWIARAEEATRLLNPAAVLRWNAHKSYLRELAVPVVPTEWNPVSLARIGWDGVVVKPAVSAGSYRTRRFGRAELAEAETFAASLRVDGDVMVQPHLPGFERERAIVWIDGEPTHVVEKRQRFDGEDEHVSDGRPPTAEEVAFAARALAGVEGLLYGRVDVVLHEGRMLLSELELLEPSLFLLQWPAALDRFADRIAAGPRW